MGTQSYDISILPKTDDLCNVPSSFKVSKPENKHSHYNLYLVLSKITYLRKKMKVNKLSANSYLSSSLYSDSEMKTYAKHALLLIYIMEI